MPGRINVGVMMFLAWIAVPGASAQSWPAKPGRIIVPFAPGGGSDILARLLAKKYQESTGQAFVVENRAGASGLIGTEVVVRAPADGYTLLVISASISVNTTLFASRVKFDTLKDLAPVALLTSAPLVLITHPSVPVRSVQELVALSKRQKVGLNGSHGGNGTTPHIALEMLAQQTGAKVVPIPYKGGSPMTAAVLSGEVDFTFGTLTTVNPHIQNGRVRALVVTTKKRSSVLPELPTMDSIYPGFEADNWYGLFVTGGTPKEIITRLNGLSVEALRSPETRNFIAKEGGDAVGGTPEEFGSHLRREVARYAKVIKAGNITAD